MLVFWKKLRSRLERSDGDVPVDFGAAGKANDFSLNMLFTILFIIFFNQTFNGVFLNGRRRGEIL